MSLTLYAHTFSSYCQKVLSSSTWACTTRAPCA